MGLISYTGQSDFKPLKKSLSLSLSLFSPQWMTPILCGWADSLKWLTELILKPIGVHPRNTLKGDWACYPFIDVTLTPLILRKDWHRKVSTPHAFGVQSHLYLLWTELGLPFPFHVFEAQPHETVFGYRTFKEVIRLNKVIGGALYPCKRKRHHSPLSLCVLRKGPMRTQCKSGCLQARKKGLTRNQSWHPNLGLSASRVGEMSVV
jgi:hypothetical protein